MSNIACIGHTTLDIILMLKDEHVHTVDLPTHALCVPFPSKCWIEKRSLSVGGNAPNAGVGLESLGHHVKLVTRIGADHWGKIIRGELSNYSFDFTYTSIESESDTSVILNYQGDRTILAYHDGAIYPFPRGLDGVEWIYYSSLGFHEFDPFHQAMLRWLDSNPSVQIVYNPGRNEIKAGFEQIRDVAQRVHTLNLNLEEAARILGLDVVDSEDKNGIKELLMRFLEHGVQRMIITDSKNGAYFAREIDQAYHIPSMPGDPVDATGAGDAFFAAYLGALAYGEDELSALRWAAAQGSHVVTKTGAIHGLLNRDDLMKRLKEYSDVQPVEMLYS